MNATRRGASRGAAPSPREVRHATHHAIPAPDAPSMMRIADVTSFYSSQAGGIRTYLRAKTRLLCARGFEVHRIVPGAIDESFRAEDGALEHRLAGPPFPFDRNYRLFGSLDQLGRLLRRLAPDVVEVGSHYLLPWRIRDLAPASARVVAFYHANLPATFVAPAVAHLPAVAARAALRASWRLVRAMHDRYDATMCAAAVVEAELRRHQVPRVVRVGLGVELERVPDAPRAPRTVCYLGRLSPDKEAALVLDGAPALAAAGVRLVVAGAGPMAARFAGCPALTYLGALPADRARQLLRDSDVCLVPGRYETFSFAAAEAIAGGTLVVCADQGAAAELALRSGCGAVFRAGDAQDLVRAVLHCEAITPAARRRASAVGREFAARELAWDPVVDRIVAVYQGSSSVARGDAPSARAREASR